MAEFCICGSLIIGGSCTNKNCKNKAANSTTSKPARKTNKAEKVTKTARSSSSRRSSKCITYNLYDLDKKGENVE
ncbi:hypothetical protein V6C42_06775 [Pseudoclostridium thermosuccinogenes]|uniref:hypothetical protein n=1 Tax=Clostridium thermosuccinogenes TaxID=84032 RepID=UPI002FDA494E